MVGACIMYISLKNTIGHGCSTALYIYCLHCLHCLTPFSLFILSKLLYTVQAIACMPIDIYCCKVRVGVFYTLYDSIQCLNFDKKWFIQCSIQCCFTRKRFCWFNSKDNLIHKSGNHWYWSNRISAKNCPKSVQIRQKGDFS